MTPRPLDWLIARPIAHRGLHDRSAGVIENTPTAFGRALACGYAIELDVQITRDGQAVVFHDETLDRLTRAQGPVRAQSLAALQRVAFRDCADRMQSVPQLFEQIDGRVPLIIEIKSLWDGDVTLAQHVARLAHNYKGPVALMSFDPHHVHAVGKQTPRVARGIVANRFDSADEVRAMSMAKRLYLRHMLHVLSSRPHFVSYDCKALPAIAPLFLKRLFAIRLITWTVRSPESAAHVLQWAEQITFEGFRPPVPAPGNESLS